MKFLAVLLTFINSAYGIEFLQYQWGLKNTGKPISHKVSDIESIQIQAKADEDINNPTLPAETKKIIKVAVIDSGVDLQHPELKSKILRNEAECKSLEKYNTCLQDEEKAKCDEKYAQIDNNNNGYPLDCNGWNIAAPINKITGIQGNNNPQDLIGHGTFVSGIIAARRDESGINGIMEHVKIIPIKVSGSDEEVPTDNTTDIFAKGIDYAIAANADIINLSVGWGFNQNSELVSASIKKAIAKGILIVVAAGNASHSSLSYPCAMNEVICVGSHNPDGKLSHFSNKGSSIDILAPGFKILSTWPLELRGVNFTQRNGFEYKNGTSFAAPFVTAALARLLNLGFNAEEAKIKLLKGSRNKNQDSLILNGNLDIDRAIKTEIKSFIYPLKKTPALINWNKEIRKVKIIFKNYHSNIKNTKLELKTENNNLNIINPIMIINDWKKDEIKELVFELTGPKSIASEQQFKLHIKNPDEDKIYPIQAVATTVIHDNFQREDAQIIKGQFKTALSKFTIKPFKNINFNSHEDYLVINENGEKINWALLKYQGDSYKLSRPQKTNLDKALLPHLARVDIDQDGSEDYIIFAFEQDKDLNWQVKIHIYDHNFKEKNYHLNTNNILKSNITTINANIFWIQINDQISPIWISNGYITENELKPLSPWEKPEINNFSPRIYYLSKTRLHTLRIKNESTEEDLEPKGFFGQDFNLKVLAYDPNIFLKNYYSVELNEPWVKREFKFKNFFDIQQDALVYSLEKQNLSFSQFNPSKEETVINTFNPHNLYINEQIIPYKTNFDAIQTVIPNDSPEKGIFALTKYNILYSLDSAMFQTENRNIKDTISYKPIRSEALYLNSNDSPGLSAEYITFDQKLHKLIKPSQYRFLKFNGCIELDFSFNHFTNEYSANFFCEKSKKFIKILF